MSIAYLNKQFLPLDQAQISVLDRGFLFADGVYEVIPVYGGQPFRLQQHLQRLHASLAGIQLQNPHNREQWHDIITQLIDKNNSGESSIYLQVTRGVHAKRDHAFPDQCAPTVFLMITPLKKVAAELKEQGVKLVSLPDIRWQYCNLKTIALLPNVLALQSAHDQDMYEAVLIRNGNATECATANIFMVEQNEIITPPKSTDLLPGITRDLVLELAAANNIACREENISESRLQNADELWLSSSTREVVAATELDGKPVGDGKPGPMWKLMAKLYADYAEKWIRGEAE